MDNIIISLESIYNIDKIIECLGRNHLTSYEINLEKDDIIIHTKHIFYIPNMCNDLKQIGYKVIKAKLQKSDCTVPLIEALNDKEIIKQEIIDENIEFDLENFYLKDLEGAICVITKNNIIFVNALIDHYKALNAVYNLLYNRSDQIKDYYSFDDNIYWQEEAVAFGNIIIQLCSNAYNTVWLPEEINSYQKQKLNEILDQISNIRKKYNIPIDVEIGRPINFLNKNSKKAI